MLWHMDTIFLFVLLCIIWYIYSTQLLKDLYNFSLSCRYPYHIIPIRRIMRFDQAHWFFERLRKLQLWGKCPPVQSFAHTVAQTLVWKKELVYFFKITVLRNVLIYTHNKWNLKAAWLKSSQNLLLEALSSLWSGSKKVWKFLHRTCSSILPYSMQIQLWGCWAAAVGWFLQHFGPQ